MNVDWTLISEFGLFGFLPPATPKDQHSVEGQLRELLKRTARKELQQTCLLLDLLFNKKMEFLQKIEAIKKNERSAFHQFQRDRNRYFHGGIPGSQFIKLSDQEKTLMINHAERAVITCNTVMSRSLGVRPITQKEYEARMLKKK